MWLLMLKPEDREVIITSSRNEYTGDPYLTLPRLYSHTSVVLRLNIKTRNSILKGIRYILEVKSTEWE